MAQSSPYETANQAFGKTHSRTTQHCRIMMQRAQKLTSRQFSSPTFAQQLFFIVLANSPEISGGLS